MTLVITSTENDYKGTGVGGRGGPFEVTFRDLMKLAVKGKGGVYGKGEGNIERGGECMVNLEIGKGGLVWEEKRRGEWRKRENIISLRRVEK